jgi:hypothetical protein
MSSKRLSPGLPVAACALFLALSGCVAAPLAQMAVMQMAPAKPACPGCSADAATGAFGEMSKGISDSFHKLTGEALPDQKVATGLPMR